MIRYTIIIEKGKRYFSAYCPDLPGVIAAGETLEETEKLMREAIEFHLEGLKLENLPLPEPTMSLKMYELYRSSEEKVI